MHNLLKRQFKKVFTESFQIPKKWQEFIDAVNNAYIEFDTDRKMLERSLELSSQELLEVNSEIMAEKNKLQSIIDAIEYGLTIQDLEYNIIFQNDVLKDISGDRFGEKCYMVYEGKDKVCDGCPVEMAYKDNKAYTTERKVIMPSGEVAFWENTANPIRDASGEIVSCIEIVRNITERKKAEEELQKSEERFRAVAISTTNLIWEGDIRNNSLEWFGDIDGALGYEQGEFPHTISGHLNSIHPEDVNELSKKFEESIETGEDFRASYRIRCKDGTFRYWDERGKAIGFENRRAVKWVGAISDITERKRLEEKLLQAQKMESVGKLAGGVAHDFNNLLTAIIGYGNLLKSEVSQDDLLISYVTQILNSAERAANLTHNLLAFSRRQMINPRPSNVNNIINSMQTFLSRIIGEDIEFIIFSTDQDLTVMADKHQIEQVLMNLVTNARDAMPDGGRLTIKTDQIELDNEFIMSHGYGNIGSYALISVEDTGQGMDEETKERLFDPFFTTKEVGKGTGLGLSMAYGIIKQHNGYISVQTEYGKGTTFNIYLPLTTLTVEKHKKLEDLPILKGGNETILVSEDETYVRDFIKEILRGNGYKVIEAIDGADAIKVLHTHKDKIQLSMLDVIMPKKDGKEVYEEIKKVSPHMKVIFISGYATDILYKKGIIEEGVNFISKPMSPDKLLIKVREVLDS